MTGSGALAVALTAAAVACWRRPRPVLERLHPGRRPRAGAAGTAGPAHPGGPAAPARTTSARPGALLAAAALGSVTAWLLGGPLGIVVGALLGAGVHRFVQGLEPAAERRARRRVEADLPVAAELLAVAVRAGATVDRAAEVVGQCLGGPLGAALIDVVAVSRDWGAAPAGAWAGLADRAGVGAGSGRAPERSGATSELARFGAAVARALDSGTPLAPALARIAADCRSRQATARSVAAARVGTRAVLPLGVCFLPSFVLLAVVPMVISIAGESLAPLG